MSFETLGLNPSILRTLADLEYTQATPIQQAAIPLILQGRDLLASAQTGTGKTAAFMLPALEKLSTPSESNVRGPRVLVLTPTRELAIQVTQAAEKYSRQLRRVKVVSVLGGMPYPVQNRLLSQPYEVLVATPGRLIDHIERGRIDFSRLELLVLDEADRMLDMGFFEDVERIASATPATRQTVMFSATFEGTIARLATELLNNPERIEIAHQQARHENIAQHMHYVDDLAHKNRLLTHLVNDAGINQAIIFTATKRDADSLADDLSAAGHRVAALHGDMHQGARNRTITQMRHGNIRLLVATDVAARGLDVPGISHVINYDLPKNPEDYVHRIGRTGRAGANGIAVSLASPRDAMQLKRIERFTGQQIPVQVIEGLEPKFKPRSQAPRGGFRNRNEGGPRRPFGEGRHGSDDSRGYAGAGRGESRGFQGEGRSFHGESRHGQPDFRRGDRQPVQGEHRFNREPRFADGNREPRHVDGNREPRFADGNREPRFADGNREPRHVDGNRFPPRGHDAARHDRFADRPRTAEGRMAEGGHWNRGTAEHAPRREGRPATTQRRDGNGTTRSAGFKGGNRSWS